MSRRRLSTTPRLSRLVAMMLLAALPGGAAFGAGGQGAASQPRKATASKATSGTPGRTPWGDPDLQGTWTTDSAFGIPWECSTLVVETTNLNGKTNYSGVEMTLTERLTRVEPDVLRYEVTIDDAKIYTRPVKISIPLTSPPGYQVLPYECHEGNRALLQSLGGARTEDRALEEDRKNGIIRERTPVHNGLTVGGAPVGGRGAAPVQAEGEAPQGR